MEKLKLDPKCIRLHLLNTTIERHSWSEPGQPAAVSRWWGVIGGLVLLGAIIMAFAPSPCIIGLGRLLAP